MYYVCVCEFGLGDTGSQDLSERLLLVTGSAISVNTFFKKIILFICLIFGCIGSSLLHAGFP